MPQRRALLARPRPLAATLAPIVLLWLCILMAAPASAEPLDLEGTWFVLIHYKDSSTANPDADRWRDMVWVFTRKSDRLQWTEYPLTVFEDTTGRFESYRGNARSRVLAAWEPNAAQRATIRRGPTVGQRGSKTKSLRGSSAKGWSSTRRQGAGSAMGSALVIGYHENVLITGLDEMPVFERQDIFGNATAKTAEGFTRLSVSEIENGARTLRGQYERDEHQHGIFRMWRTPPVRKPSQRG